MNIEHIKAHLYRRCFDRHDYGRVDKIIAVFLSGKMTKENYWDCIRKLTKNVTSDHSLHSWQCLAECAENQLFEEATP
jgi:hypothetical protein